MAIDSWFVGRPLSADDLNDAYPLGIIALGNRGSNKALSTTNTGYLRVDGVALKNGRTYAVVAANIRLSITTSVGASDHYTADIRQDLTGAAATTASTEIGRSELTAANSTSDDTYPPIIALVHPSADVTGSFLLSARFVTGAITASLQADSPGINLFVVDLGIAVADTGVDI